MAIYTIGHSTLSEADFIKLVEPLDIIMDVRSHPGSKWPQFRKPYLEQWLPSVGKKYVWESRLGGWDARHLPLAEKFAALQVDIPVYARGKFPKQRIALGSKEPTPNECLQESLPGIRPSWTNQGLYDYSWFMSLDEFRIGIQELIKRSQETNIAIMCAECQWWRCHRSMISDYISFTGNESIHITPRFRQKNLVKFVDGNKMINHSQVIGDRLSRYDDRILQIWRSDADKWLNPR
ncbi:MAG TPA: DUF488 domain-containing protein [Methylobacter sp.]|jgi:hypothetical protein